MRTKAFTLSVFVLAVVVLPNCGVVSQADHCFAVIPNTMKGLLIVDVETATSRLIQRPPELPDTATLFDIAPVGWSEDGESLIMIEQYVEQNRLFSINLDT